MWIQLLRPGWIYGYITELGPLGNSATKSIGIGSNNKTRIKIGLSVRPSVYINPRSVALTGHPNYLNTQI